MEEHLRQNGFTTGIIDSLLNPEDKQDILAAYAFLKALRELPDAPLDSTPTFRRAREALKILGNLGVRERS
jgi:hypothetical protein